MGKILFKLSCLCRATQTTAQSTTEREQPSVSQLPCLTPADHMVHDPIHHPWSQICSPGTKETLAMLLLFSPGRTVGEKHFIERLNWLQMAKLAFQTKLLFGLSSSPISGTAACSSLALANLFSPAQMLLLAGVAPRGSLPFPIATAPITWQTLLSRQVSAGNLLHPLDPRC